MELQRASEQLFIEIKGLIDLARQQASLSVNRYLTILYWEVGNRINQDILKNERSAYGEQILPTLSAKLTVNYGKSYSPRNLKRMIDFAVNFPEKEQIVQG